MITDQSCLLFLEVRERLQGFLVFGFNERDCQSEGCKIYDDKECNQYGNGVIKIKVEQVHYFSKVAINLPKHKQEATYLTLCEVEIFAAGNALFFLALSHLYEN